jgi:hypothetical protein
VKSFSGEFLRAFLLHRKRLRGTLGAMLKTAAYQRLQELADGTRALRQGAAARHRVQIKNL